MPCKTINSGGKTYCGIGKNKTKHSWKPSCVRTGDCSGKFRASGYGADTRTNCGHYRFGEPAIFQHCTGAFFRHRSLVHFLLQSLMRQCTTKFIRNGSLQGRWPWTQLKTQMCKNRWSFRKFLDCVSHTVHNEDYALPHTILRLIWLAVILLSIWWDPHRARYSFTTTAECEIVRVVIETICYMRLITTELKSTAWEKPCYIALDFDTVLQEQIVSSAPQVVGSFSPFEEFDALVYNPSLTLYHWKL